MSKETQRSVEDNYVTSVWWLSALCHSVVAYIVYPTPNLWIACFPWLALLVLTTISYFRYLKVLSSQNFLTLVELVCIMGIVSLVAVTGGTDSPLGIVLALFPFGKSEEKWESNTWTLGAVSWMIMFVLSALNIDILPNYYFNKEILKFVTYLTVIFGSIIHRELISLKLALLRADTSNEIKKQSLFFATMSHEIRTPLTSIIGWTDMLLYSKEIPDSASYYLEIIKTSGAHLLTIVNDILDFSKIEHNKIVFEQAPFDLRRLLDNTIDYVAILKHDEVEFTVDVRLPTARYVLGDSHRLLQCLTNLLSNAAKFTARGSIVLKCSEGETSRGYTTIKFSVSDTGIGMSSSVVSRLFIPFEQAEHDTARKYGGSGLGLVITKQLIKKMKGDISVDSKAGIGTTFSFFIQLKCCSPDYFRKHSQQLALPMAPTKLQVLLAEDNKLNQKLIQTQLEKLGHVCDISKDGKEAVARAFAKPYDLILMDIQMPELSGTEAAKKIRSDHNSNSRDSIIVALTASADTATRNEVSTAGMDDFISKPATLDDLRKKISSVQFKRWEQRVSDSIKVDNNNNNSSNVVSNSSTDSNTAGDNERLPKVKLRTKPKNASNINSISRIRNSISNNSCNFTVDIRHVEGAQAKRVPPVPESPSNIRNTSSSNSTPPSSKGGLTSSAISSEEVELIKRTWDMKRSSSSDEYTDEGSSSRFKRTIGKRPTLSTSSPPTANIPFSYYPPISTGSPPDSPSLQTPPAFSLSASTPAVPAAASTIPVITINDPPSTVSAPSSPINTSHNSTINNNMNNDNIWSNSSNSTEISSSSSGNKMGPHLLLKSKRASNAAITQTITPSPGFFIKPSLQKSASTFTSSSYPGSYSYPSTPNNNNNNNPNNNNDNNNNNNNNNRQQTTTTTTTSTATTVSSTTVARTSTSANTSPRHRDRHHHHRSHTAHPATTTTTTNTTTITNTTNTTNINTTNTTSTNTTNTTNINTNSNQ